MFKKYRGSTNHYVTLAKIQTAREASQNLTLIGNCQRFYSHGSAVLHCPLAFCVRVHRVVAVTESQSNRGMCLTSQFDGTLNSMVLGDYL